MIASGSNLAKAWNSTIELINFTGNCQVYKITPRDLPMGKMYFKDQ